jgi:hypothetical protein
LVESDDCLLRLLLDLDLNSSECFGSIEGSFLSMDGLKPFVAECCFDEVCDDSWLPIVFLLRDGSLDEFRARRSGLSL